MAPWNRRNDDGQAGDLLSQDGNQQQQQDADSTSPGHLQQSPADDAKPPVYTSQIAAAFIFVNVTIGASLLAMPFAVQEAGIVTSMIVQLVFLILIVITCIMCIELTVKSEVRSYHELIQKHCHPFVYQFTQAAILVMVFALTIAYIVVIGDQSDRIFDSLYGPTFCKAWYMHRRFIMSMTTLVAIKPLCSARTVDFLKYASFLGLISIGFIFYVVASNFAKTDHIPSDVNYYPKSWSDVGAVLPVFCLAYQVHLSLVPTIATIRPQEKPKAFITSTLCMIICHIVYSFISVMAVLSFGSKIEKDLTESFPGKTWATLGTVAIVGIKCALTLPAAFLPARLSLVDLLTKNWSRFANFSEPVRRVSVTLLFLDAALLLAIVVPDILTVVNLIGCVAVMFIFPLPGLAYISLVGQNRREKQLAAGMSPDEPLKFTAKDRMKLWASYFMMVFGFLMTGVVLYKSISELMTSTPSVPLCRV